MTIKKSDAERGAYLQMTLRVEEQILRLDVTMGDTLAVEVVDASEDLLEAAFDLRWRHAAAFDRSIEITARAELHNFTPVQLLVLDEINRLDDVDVMKGRRNAELGSELLDVLLLRLVLPSFPEFLAADWSESGTPRHTDKDIPSLRRVSLPTCPTCERDAQRR